MNDQHKRSPLKSKPLRTPGQSLDEEIHKLVDDKFNSYALVSALFILLAAHEWIIWSTNALPQPGILTILAVGVLLYSAYRVYQLRKRVILLKQGRDGEKAVGQYLENLRISGSIVFHDIIGNGFNIDHVVLSKRGIYAIETKTYSKPARGEALISFEDGVLVIDGHKTDGSILKQAKGEAAEVANILKESTGKDYPVKPVILFPGWYVDKKANRSGQGFWLLNPKALPKFIENQPEILSAEDIQLAAYHMSRHIRSL